MKVLTVKNPWAWLIMHGGKDVENRTWPTSDRGRIAIHASKTPVKFKIADPYMPTAEEIDFAYLLNESEEKNGNILGLVTLTDCIRDSTSTWAEPGLWHWVLKDPRPCKPIPVKGSLGLWEYKGDMGI
jgi:hypothetical protein